MKIFYNYNYPNEQNSKSCQECETNLIDKKENLQLDFKN